MTAHPDLVAHAAQFPKSVLTLAPGVYGFVGFAASNVYVIEGDESLCVVDTTESTKAAQNILAELRRLTDKPITDIVYTHSHRDHISGATVFAGAQTPRITAWQSFSSDLIGAETGPKQALTDRARKQFGFGLSFPDERVNIGCGPGDRPVEGLGQGHLPPTHLIDAPRTTTTLVGRPVELIHAPGETPDHLLIWMPEDKVLISGDNFYHSFPNLYPIRGSAYRDFSAWVRSLDLMRALKPHVLAPGHTLPVSGADAIAERLTDYRDAIAFVIEATSEALNAGRAISDFAADVRLPDHLADKPWLTEYYGRLDWSVQAYAAGTLGWFGGNPTDLAQLPRADMASRTLTLAGGPRAVVAAAQDSDDPRWTLHLCDLLLDAGAETEHATTLKATTMRELADQMVNATARNYYLVSAQDLEAAR